MYQVSFKGYFETEDPNKLLEEIKRAATDTQSDIIGQFEAYKLAPYVDYQKADVTDASD